MKQSQREKEDWNITKGRKKTAIQWTNEVVLESKIDKHERDGGTIECMQKDSTESLVDFKDNNNHPRAT